MEEVAKALEEDGHSVYTKVDLQKEIDVSETAASIIIDDCREEISRQEINNERTSKQDIDRERKKELTYCTMIEYRHRETK